MRKQMAEAGAARRNSWRGQPLGSESHKVTGSSELQAITRSIGALRMHPMSQQARFRNNRNSSESARDSLMIGIADAPSMSSSERLEHGAERFGDEAVAPTRPHHDGANLPIRPHLDDTDPRGGSGLWRDHVGVKPCVSPWTGAGQQVSRVVQVPHRTVWKKAASQRVAQRLVQGNPVIIDGQPQKQSFGRDLLGARQPRRSIAADDIRRGETRRRKRHRRLVISCERRHHDEELDLSAVPYHVSGSHRSAHCFSMK